MAYVPEKGWFWYIPQHNDMISVGVVAEGKYLTRDGVKATRGHFQARDRTKPMDQATSRRAANPTGSYYLTSEYTHHAQHCAMEGLLLVGDAFAFLDPVFSSGVMLALKSGVMAADAVHEGVARKGFFAGTVRRITPRPCARAWRTCASWFTPFTIPSLFFVQVINKYPAAAGWITDCLSGDVNKDFSQLWKWIEEFVPLPEDLPVGQPLVN